MPEDERQILRRTRALAALPARFTAWEGRFTLWEQRWEQRQAAFEAELRDELRQSRAEVEESRGELRAALVEIRETSREIRRLVEARVLAEAESTELVGKLLQRAEARLEALEQDPSTQAR